MHKKTVLVDEFIMHHPGNILRVLSSEVKRVILVGDIQQLPYVSPVPYVNLRYTPNYFIDQASRIERMTVTYRSPLTATRILSNYYPGLTTENKFEGTIEILIKKLDNLREFIPAGW